MSETASFVDPVFLARFGLSRVNVLDYFLHPLNPFRTSVNTSNEVLAMQGIGIGQIMQQGLTTNGNVPMAPPEAEEEYARALSRVTGEQYELLPPKFPAEASALERMAAYTTPSPLYTIRHVLRTHPTSVKIMGIYYVVEGVIYKAPSVRALHKANVTRTLDGLAGACFALGTCAKFHASTGYLWNFEASIEKQTDDDEDEDGKNSLDCVLAVQKLHKRHKRRKIFDNRPPGDRNEAEEEGLRASAAMDQILVRLSKQISTTPSLVATSSSQAKGKSK